MKKYKHKGRQALLWLVLFLNLCVPLPCSAGFETLQFTDPTTPEGKLCDLGKMTSAERNNPWWKPPMSAVINASTSVGNGVFNSVAPGAKGLMIVGACLWLAVFTLKIVGGFVESDPMENLTKVGGLMLRVGIAAWLLAHRDFFFSTFFAPIIQTGAGFVGVGIKPPPGGNGLSEAGSAAIGIASAAHDTIAQFKAKGDYLKCLSKIHKLDLTVFEITLWDPGAFFSGCLINLAGWVFIGVFPFFLIDACFRMGVVAALCPLFIVSWVFQSTRSYALKGLNAVINVAFTFMMVKIAADVAIALLVDASGMKSVSNPAKLVCQYRFTEFGDRDLCSQFGAQGSGMGLGSMFIFCICVIYGLLLIKEGADKLANYFSDTGFTNDTAFQAAKGGAQAALSSAHTIVETGAKAAPVAGAVASAGVSVAGKGLGAIRHGLGAVGSRAASLFKGTGKKSSSGSSSPKTPALNDWANKRKGMSATRPKSVPQNATYNAKNKTWTSEYKDKNGTTRTTVMDEKGGRLSVTDKDKNGNVTAETRYKDGNPVRTMSATYDDVGRKVSETVSEKGRTIARKFEEGQLASQTEKSSDGTTTISEWRRDQNGKVTTSSVEINRADGSKDETVFEHDSNGRKTGGEKMVTTSDGKRKSFSVDEEGNRPNAIPQDAKYDVKTQSWSSSYTDKKTGETTRTVMDKRGGRLNVTKTDRDGREISSQRYRNGNPVSDEKK